MVYAQFKKNGMGHRHLKHHPQQQNVSLYVNVGDTAFTTIPLYVDMYMQFTPINHIFCLILVT